MFFRVSAAVHARPSSRGSRAFARSTRVAMVGVSGESKTRAADWPSMGIDSGTSVVNASTLAA